MKKSLILAFLLSAISLNSNSFANSPQKLIINGNEVDMGTQKIFLNGDNTIIPLRLTAENLGFDIKYDEANNTVLLDNKAIKTELTIGYDLYYKQSSNALGLTNKFALGYPPTIIDDSVYVPLKMYNLLFSNDNAAKFENDTVYINSSKSKIELPNPVISYNSIEEAKNAIDFEFKLPKSFLDYKLDNVSIINKTLIDLKYLKGDTKISFRASQTKGDISGVYTQYDNQFKILDADVKGNDNLIYLVSFVKDDINYSIYCNKGFTQAEIINLITEFN